MVNHCILQLVYSFDSFKTIYRALHTHTFSSLWEQTQMPFPFPSSDFSVNILGHSILTGNKTQTPNNFSWCPNPDRCRGTFFHTLFLPTYVNAHHNNEWSPQTISHSKQDESVNRTCFWVRSQHSVTQSGSSRRRGGQIRKDSRLKRQLQRCHYACLPSKSPYPPPRRQKQCLLFYLATGV